MGKRLMTRRPVRGTAGMLIVMLALLARLVAPAVATPFPEQDVARGLTRAGYVADPGWAAICHADPADRETGAPDPAHHAPHADCFLCPVCHATVHAVVPVISPALPRPAWRVVGRTPSPLLATGPPSRPASVHPSTGPPARPV